MSLEWITDYILKWTKKIQTEDIHSIDGVKAAMDDYNTYTQEFMKQTVWSYNCRSWYKNQKVDGRVAAMYPGSILHFKAMIDQLRPEDFAVKYKTANRFAFMNNGFTKREMNNQDLSYYLQK